MSFFSDFFQILKDVEFANPAWFFSLFALIPLIGWQIWKRHQMYATMRVSTIEPFAKSSRSWKQRFRWLPLLMEIIAIVFFVTALTRPQSAFRQNEVQVEGVDIVLALDISGSMKAMDFKPNRLGVTKKVAAEFIKNRPTDRIGLVVYAGEAYTQCPITTDHATLLGLLESVDFDRIDDGTAIGDGLGTAINRLRDSEAKSKIIILLSDGVNNTGYLDPYAAAEIAKNMDIKVYTIGCGSKGTAPFPTPYGVMQMESEIDETLLKNMAKETGGEYFRATNSQKLQEVYEEIDKMEKTIINETVFEHKNDEFTQFLIIGFFFFALFLFLRFFIFRINL
ncbi:MAG: VWA domain-containing protein [Bacteroidales bacterium]|jgi:Ca-activated chloride channel family protein|nr:VWA domain-containing protein [Bacteroidales bacterium]